MSAPRLNLKGKVFNGITFLHPVENEKGRLLSWMCLCHCGKEFTVRGNCISSGTQKSCGCLSGSPKHGEKKTRFYKCWSDMKARCLNKNKTQWTDYGGRGITLCERWMEYLNFKEDMFSSYADNLFLDRIDNNGNYELSNCKWSTRSEQNSNTRRNNYFETPFGRMTVMEIANASGLCEHTIRYRIMRNSGITFEQLILPAKPGVSLKRRIMTPE